MARWIRPEKREKIVSRGGNVCVYCGSPVVSGQTASGCKAPSNAAHLDHIVPRAVSAANEMLERHEPPNA